MLHNLKLKISLLVTAIIILVIIAVFVFLIPKLKNSNTQNQTKNTQAIANSLSAANSINYLKRKKDPTEGNVISNCKDVAVTLVEGLPHGYNIRSLPVLPDKSEICTLNGPGHSIGTFFATGII